MLNVLSRGLGAGSEKNGFTSGSGSKLSKGELLEYLRGGGGFSTYLESEKYGLVSGSGSNGLDTTREGLDRGPAWL